MKTIVLMMWDHRVIVGIAAAALRGEAGRLDAEQAVRGVDALEEVGLHGVLAAGFLAEGWAGADEAGSWGVVREQPYPGDRVTVRRREEGDEAEGEEAEARESERRRCDLVLTPRRGVGVADPLRVAKRERKRRAEVEGTLFEGLEQGKGEEKSQSTKRKSQMPESDAAAGGDPTVPPEGAFWLEVKLVGQYCYESGVPGPNRTYGSQLVRGVAADLAKLARDPFIEHGGVLLVLFTEDERVAEHDLVATMHRCLDRGVAAGSPVTESFGITERIGNCVCTVALIPAVRE